MKTKVIAAHRVEASFHSALKASAKRSGLSMVKELRALALEGLTYRERFGEDASAFIKYEAVERAELERLKRKYEGENDRR